MATMKGKKEPVLIGGSSGLWGSLPSIAELSESQGCGATKEESRTRSVHHELPETSRPLNNCRLNSSIPMVLKNVHHVNSDYSYLSTNQFVDQNHLKRNHAWTQKYSFAVSLQFSAVDAVPCIILIIFAAGLFLSMSH